MLIFQFHHFIKEEFVDAYREAIVTNAQKTVQEPGIIRFDVFQDKKDPAHFSLLEIYEDMAARAAHLETEHFLVWKEAVLGQEMFAENGKGDEFEPVFVSLE
ncbi:MAG: antibiotic biosynthesis monooxygenase [Anaerolineales bacterium]|nr:antibiotic biosynthesis monooxygenase [Chloroflexota bacterium]MBL6980977.1 antibiotic biosynthesis monooxygenase [Anaerolineales bacterium]